MESVGEQWKDGLSEQKCLICNLPDKDLLLRVERVGDNVKQLTGLSLESLLLGLSDNLFLFLVLICRGGFGGKRADGAVKDIAGLSTHRDSRGSQGSGVVGLKVSRKLSVVSARQKCEPHGYVKYRSNDRYQTEVEIEPTRARGAETEVVKCDLAAKAVLASERSMRGGYYSFVEGYLVEWVERRKATKRVPSRSMVLFSLSPDCGEVGDVA